MYYLLTPCPCWSRSLHALCTRSYFLTDPDFKGVLHQPQLSARCPAIKFDDTDIGCLEVSSGTLYADKCLRAFQVRRITNHVSNQCHWFTSESYIEIGWRDWDRCGEAIVSNSALQYLLYPIYMCSKSAPTTNRCDLSWPYSLNTWHQLTAIPKWLRNGIGNFRDLSDFIYSIYWISCVHHQLQIIDANRDDSRTIQSEDVCVF